MEPRYNLLFTGQLKASCSPQQAITEVASAFSLPTEAVSKLILGGEPRVIRRDLDQQTADRLMAALSKAGLEVRLVPVQVAAPTGSPVSAPVSAPVPAPVPMSKPVPEQASARSPVASQAQTSARSRVEPAGERCPRCGSSRVEAGSCQVCGVSIDQFRIRQAVSSRLGGVADPDPDATARTAAARSVNPRTGAGPSPFASRNRALGRTIGNPRARDRVRVPIYLLGAGALGLGLVVLMVALQPEPTAPSADSAQGPGAAVASGTKSTGAVGGAGAAGSAGAVGADGTAGAARSAGAAGSAWQAPSSLTGAGLGGEAGAEAEAQRLALPKALKDLEAKAATAAPQPPPSEPLDELPPDIRALYEAQQARQSLGNTFKQMRSEPGTP